MCQQTSTTVSTWDPFSVFSSYTHHLRIRPSTFLTSRASEHPALRSRCSPNQDQRMAKPRPSEKPRAPPVATHRAPPHPRPIVPKPHRGACQNEDGFLSRESHVGVRLHQGLHSRQRQPRETSSGRTRRGWGLRSGCVPTGALLLPGSPASRRHRRHPGPERPARGRQLCARRRRRPLSRARWKPRPLRACDSAPHAAEHTSEFF